MSGIIQDLISDILLCLPVKSLVRYRCLSKSSRTEIDSETFINAHLTRSIETKTRRRLILERVVRLNKCTVVGLDELEQGRLVVQDGQNFHDRSIRGSCNGLVLLEHHDHHGRRRFPFSLWNPFTKRIKELAVFNPQDPFYGITHLGFGYDRGSNDYKLVGIRGHYRFSDIWFFSLVSNSWKKLQITCPKKIRDCTSNGIFAHGALHWRTYGNHGYEIVSFDMSKQEFLPVLEIKPQIISSNARVHAKLVMPGHNVGLGPNRRWG
ncbi:hypothetical protein COLO4_11812 [Corchorus olitorius]|uniref:F-box domain-containing protein n=1 Tax=Corchorus olitorius TaxID=93759 RepID=A0A1R3K349_9ROSI|nr:hypothetical protein COLO4_11812 [Corchorus olitorius]